MTIRKIIRSLAALAACFVAGQGLGGVGAGNEWKHFVNDGFDFHVASPSTWQCQGCEPEARKLTEETAESWRLSSPARTTWFGATFLSDFPAECEERCDLNLLAEIRRRHPNVEWRPFKRGGDDSFIGFTSSPLGDDANEAMEYYLVDKRQALRLEWQKDEGDAPRARELDNVKRTIDRVSRSPEVISIRTERDGAYRVGETACLLIEVDDLRAAFNARSLTNLTLQGVPEHASFKTIEWVGAKNWFRACFVVTTGFGEKGLEVLNLDIEGEDDRSVHCYRKDPAAPELYCPSGGYQREDRPGKTVMPAVGPVTGAVMDQAGPEIRGLLLDRERLTLTVDAVDPSGVGIGEIRQGDLSVVAFPDQLANGRPVSIAHLTHNGWNLVERLVIYDANGYPTLLRIPESPALRRGGPEYYEVVPWKGEPYLSNLPVLNFLKAGGPR